MTDIKIGDKYLTRGKHPRLCTVVDILKTYNHKGEHVRTTYLSTHEFCGQPVTNHNVVATTIQIGKQLLEERNK